MSVNKHIAANSQRRITVKWDVETGNQFLETDRIVTTYRFVDDNGHTKELKLVDDQTMVSGLREDR